MELKKIIFKPLFLACLLVVLVLISLVYINLQVEHDRSLIFDDDYFLNTHDTMCFDKKLITQEINENYSSRPYIIAQRDVYLSEKISNVFCIGKVVDIYIENDGITVFIGTNQKVTSLFYLINFVMLVCFSGSVIVSKKLLSLIISIMSSFFISLYSYNQIEIIELITNFFMAFLIIFISSYFLDKNLYFEYKFLINNKIKNIDQKFINFPSSVKNRVIYFVNFFILSLSSVFAYLSFTRSNKASIVNDVLIQIYTSSKMFYLNQTSFEAAWNQHTPIIPNIYKFIYYFVDYGQFDKGLIVLKILFALACSLTTYLVLYKLKVYKSCSILVASISFIFYLSINLLNRELGILIFLLIFYNLLNYLEKKSKVNLILIIFLSALQVYNLESFTISIIYINIFLIYMSENKKQIISDYILYTTCSIILIYSSLIFNNEINDLLTTNYLFHLQNINSQFENASLLNAIGLAKEGSNFNLRHLLVFSLIVYFIRKIINKSLKPKNINTLLFLWILIEIFNLVITGPRFWNYGIILVIPTLILTLVLLSEKIKNELGLFVIIILFLPVYLFLNITDHSNPDNTNIEFLENEQILMHFSERSTAEPELILTWIHPTDWQWLYNSGNFNPSTRYWWWFYMRYHQDHMYTWNNNWDEKDVIASFKSDLEKERPKYAVINTSINKPPTFLNDIIKNEYKLTHKNDSILIYEKNTP